MIRYISLIRFTEQAAKNINKSTARALSFRKAFEKAGVRVEAQYWTTGGYDGLLILAGTDENKILHCLSELAAAGNVRTETLRAFDASEFEAIVGK